MNKFENYIEEIESYLVYKKNYDLILNLIMLGKVFQISFKNIFFCEDTSLDVITKSNSNHTYKIKFQK
jgi:hypothetical protein